MKWSHFDVVLPRDVQRMLQVFVVLGALTLAAGIFLAPERIWPNFLLVNYYLLGIGLAGLLFVALLYVTTGAWGVALRRVPEAMTAAIPFAAIGLGILFLVRPSLYSWTQPSAEAAPAFRRFWLSQPFFDLRAAVYLLLWILFAGLLVRTSRRQDEDGDLAHTRRNLRRSAIFLVIFGVTFWLASYDWIMSLEPNWSSTIFGIYNFAGLFSSGVAAIILLAVYLERLGPLHNVLTEDHLHDLGKLLFAFSTFWMYIWFSQYMLIWYANIPEETVYFTQRLHGYWQPLFILNMLLNWAVPFLALLSRPAKRRAGTLVKVAVVVLVGRWLDLYLMILPPYTGAQPAFGAWELGLMLGALGLFVLIFFRAFRQAPVVPVRDPYLEESLHYQH
jgi:hypothetical protein